tara:strand:- start:1011 stop:2138 length:1128 start_codon:yes stop_codon:yes gene_type:complete
MSLVTHLSNIVDYSDADSRTDFLFKLPSEFECIPDGVKSTISIDNVYVPSGGDTLNALQCPSYKRAFQSINVDTNNEIIIPNHGLEHGMTVKYTISGGTPIGGIVHDTDYIVHWVSPDRISLMTGSTIKVLAYKRAFSKDDILFKFTHDGVTDHIIITSGGYFGNDDIMTEIPKSLPGLDITTELTENGHIQIICAAQFSVTPSPVDAIKKVIGLDDEITGTLVDGKYRVTFHRPLNALADTSDHHLLTVAPKVLSGADNVSDAALMSMSFIEKGVHFIENTRKETYSKKQLRHSDGACILRVPQEVTSREGKVLGPRKREFLIKKTNGIIKVNFFDLDGVKLEIPRNISTGIVSITATFTFEPHTRSISLMNSF